MVSKFREFLLIDLRRSKRTARDRSARIERLLGYLGKRPSEVTVDDLRQYLKLYLDKAPGTYSSVVKAFKLFFRDYLKRPGLVETFRFPREPFKPRVIPKKEELQKLFAEIDDLREKALFMLYATSGLRRMEILALRFEDVDFEKCMISPQKGESRTKHVWISFYNSEAEIFLKQHLALHKTENNKIFPIARYAERMLWRKAAAKTGIRITPQVLRDWFCSEMGELGVQDRYVDAFCGRVPRSILARHHTDFSPDRLKAIYDKAGLKVLS